MFLVTSGGDWRYKETVWWSQSAVRSLIIITCELWVAVWVSPRVVAGHQSAERCHNTIVRNQQPILSSWWTCHWQLWDGSQGCNCWRPPERRCYAIAGREDGIMSQIFQTPSVSQKHFYLPRDLTSQSDAHSDKISQVDHRNVFSGYELLMKYFCSQLFSQLKYFLFAPVKKRPGKLSEENCCSIV